VCVCVSARVRLCMCARVFFNSCARAVGHLISCSGVLVGVAGGGCCMPGWTAYRWSVLLKEAAVCLGGQPVVGQCC